MEYFLHNLIFIIGYICFKFIEFVVMVYNKIASPIRYYIILSKEARKIVELSNKIAVKQNQKEINHGQD